MFYGIVNLDSQRFFKNKERVIQMNNEKTETESNFHEWALQKEEGFEYLKLIFLVSINIFLLYDLSGSAATLLAGIGVIIMGIFFFRIVTEREMENLRNQKNIAQDSIFYAFFYLVISVLVFSVFATSIIFGILVPLLMFFNLQVLRSFAMIRFKKKTENWLKGLNLSELYKKEDWSKKMDIELSEIEGVEYAKNNPGADLFLVLGKDLGAIDKGIEKFFISEEKRVSIRAAKLLEKMRKEKDFDLYYNFADFKKDINRTKKDTIVFCHGITEMNLKAVKADL